MNAEQLSQMNLEAMGVVSSDLGPDETARRSNQLLVDSRADNAEIARIFSAMTELPVIHVAMQRVFYTPDTSRSGAVALHNLTGTGEAEVTAWLMPGMLKRSILRYAAQWIFRECGIPRLVCRIPVHDERTQDYARRIGFQFEGRQRRYFSRDSDASVWVMFPDTCRWLRA